jgi:hypothetical protein
MTASATPFTFPVASRLYLAVPQKKDRPAAIEVYAPASPVKPS